MRIVCGQNDESPPTAQRPFCRSELAGYEAWYVSRRAGRVGGSWLRVGSAPPRGICDLQAATETERASRSPQRSKAGHATIARPKRPPLTAVYRTRLGGAC